MDQHSLVKLSRSGELCAGSLDTFEVHSLRTYGLRFTSGLRSVIVPVLLPRFRLGSRNPKCIAKPPNTLAEVLNILLRKRTGFKSHFAEPQNSSKV
jgi:hypothetical protein